MQEEKLHKFAILPSYYEAASKLPPAKRDQFLASIVMYGVTLIEPQFDDYAMAAMFELVKPTIENSVAYFDSKKDNGKKGGRPRGSKNQNKPKANQSQTEINPNVTQNNRHETDVKPKNSEIKRSKSERKRESSLSLSPSQLGGGVGEGRDPAKDYASIDDIGEHELTAIAADLSTTPSFVKTVLQRLRHYCGSTGTIYTDYYDQLWRFVESDRDYPANKITPPTLPPEVKTDAEIARIRAMMPDFIAKKVGTILLVAVVYQADRLIPAFSGWETPLRDITIYALVVNDFISVIENLGEWGVDIPKVITDRIAELKGKSQENIDRKDCCEN